MHKQQHAQYALYKEYTVKNAVAVTAGKYNIGLL